MLYEGVKPEKSARACLQLLKKEERTTKQLLNQMDSIVKSAEIELHYELEQQKKTFLKVIDSEKEISRKLQAEQTAI